MKKIKVRLNSWIYLITIVTFIVTIIVSYITDLLMGQTELIVAIFVVLFIVLIGVIFDTIGIAVAAGSPEPFHAMASARIKSAKYSLKLLNNASQVSNFFNDVIGDIAGIVSGAASAVIVVKIMSLDGSLLSKTVINTLLSAVVASLTVGGKAIGKEIALNYSKEIVDFTGKVMYVMVEKTPLKMLKNK